MLRSTAAESFLTKFKDFNVADLQLKAYPSSYCQHLLAHLDYYVLIYQQIIKLAVKAANKPVSALTVLDFGAGNGLLGMFAKHYGFKKVWLCDVAPDFLEAAEKTASNVQIGLDGFIAGDMDAVQEYFAAADIKPDILLSTDVIEHIYDLEHLFQQLHLLNPCLVSVFTTASNPFNLKKVKELNRVQYRDEWEGYSELSEEELRDKGYSAISFFEQRKQIIRNAFAQLPESVVDELACFTRGKRVNDILSSVDNYLQTGILPHPPLDAHWVCDPSTGSWTERILPLEAYREIFYQAGFALHWTNGFYNPYSKTFVSSLLVRGVNRLIKLQKEAGKFLAPYLVLQAVPAQPELCPSPGMSRKAL